MKNENNILKVKTSGIFTNYIFKSIPLAFDESLSYYETLCGLLAYIKNVENVVNNNADVISNLNDEINKLQNYVDNYFKNLDIQNEINQKLDEMAESGELANIISQYLNINCVLAYDTIADMKIAENIVEGSFLKTYGDTSINDGLGKFYKVRQLTSDDNIDDINIIKLVNYPSLIAELIKELNCVNVKTYGAKGNGITDDTQAFKKAISECSNSNKYLFIDNGNYLISETIDIPQSVSIIGANKENVTITCNTPNINIFNMSITSGGANNTIKNLSLRSTTNDVNGINLINVNKCNIENINFIGLKTNITIDGGGLNNILNCSSIGNENKAGSLWIGSTDQTKYGSVFTSIINYFIDGGNGVQSPAIHFDRAVGIKCDNIITNNSDGTGQCILIENDSQGITIENSLIVAYDTAIRMQSKNGYMPLSNTFSNVDIDQCSNYAYLITGAKNLTINGGNITSSNVGTNKIINYLEGPDVQNVLITNVNVTGYFANPGTAFFTSGVNKVDIKNCLIDSCYQGIGQSGTSSNSIIENISMKDVNYPIVGDWSNNNNYIHNIEGYNPISTFTSPSLPASEEVYTNNTGYDLRCFIHHGSVNLIRINGSGVLFNSGMFILKKGETLQVNYSGSPIFQCLPL